MKIIRDTHEMQAWSSDRRREGLRVGVVPTMGYLHEGHLSLVRLAKAESDVVILTLFVNPTQFGPNEDLERYPRDFERDCALCEAEGVDVLFAPSGGVYAEDHTVYVVEDVLSARLCGASRPGHFRGVLTVVAKLFNLTLPDVAVFGEKDAQQLRLIRRMTRDLNFPVKILSGPIVREADGLAMSSRNRNLDAASRAVAPRLNEALRAAEKAFAGGERGVQALRTGILKALGDLAPGELDYLEILDDQSLSEVGETIRSPVLVALAVRFPGVRLIDNTTLNPEESPHANRPK
ncbi:MAG: pantoate--beta-alanine ligase [Verrucomicrobia bacterium]|nr:pantoate--beta-alanine ligase [Verrucomicrobiota bacterium]MCH8512857.1 pantoate--beta-alanine ligase [Kiritimatiellia bacterium]